MKIKESSSNIILNQALFVLCLLDILGENGDGNSKNES